MSIATKQYPGAKAVNAADSIVDTIILTAILLIIAFACYAMWDSNQVHEMADAKQYEVYKPSSDDSVSFQELQLLNPEVFSWLTVYGTNIDYPVAQAQNNDKYVTTDAYGNYSASGCIFLDADNDKSFRDFNSIMYGHHMEKNAMFGNLDLFAQEHFFESHAYGNLFFDGTDHGLEFFAFIQTDAYDRALFSSAIQGQEAQQDYVRLLLDKALYTRDIGVTIQDKIVLLCTCSADSTNGRDILVARITDTTYPNTFKTEEANDTKLKEFVDKQSPLYCLPPLLLLVFIVALVYASRKTQENRNQQAIQPPTEKEV
jgi:sortase B